VSFTPSVDTATGETSVFVGVARVPEIAPSCSAVSTSQQLATSSTAKTSWK
jgi:hypothetical protein